MVEEELIKRESERDREKGRKRGAMHLVATNVLKRRVHFER